MPFGCSGRVDCLCQTRLVRCWKGTSLHAQQLQHAVQLRFGQLVIDAVRIHALRGLAHQAQDHGLVGGVADAGQGQRAVQMGFDADGASRAPHSSRKRRAATIGPTVCELEGPMPILNKSNTLMSMSCLLKNLLMYMGSSLPLINVIPAETGIHTERATHSQHGFPPARSFPAVPGMTAAIQAVWPTSTLSSIDSTISSTPIFAFQPQSLVARASSRLFGHESAICWRLSGL
jgi:hypothetical protein